MPELGKAATNAPSDETWRSRFCTNLLAVVRILRDFPCDTVFSFRRHGIWRRIRCFGAGAGRRRCVCQFGLPTGGTIRSKFLDHVAQWIAKTKADRWAGRHRELQRPSHVAHVLTMNSEDGQIRSGFCKHRHSAFSFGARRGGRRARWW